MKLKHDVTVTCSRSSDIFVPTKTRRTLHLYFRRFQPQRIEHVNKAILTHFRLNKLAHTIYIESVNFMYVRLYDRDSPREKSAKLFANSGDPDQSPHSAESHRGLNCVQLPF